MDQNTTVQQETKFCKECGQKIAKKAVICPLCGCQVEETKHEAAPQIVINNSNQNTNQNVNAGMGMLAGHVKNKWVALLLCIWLGWLGAHKFYENKAVVGILYMCSFGLFGVGIVLDIISLLGKPNPYFVS